MACALQAHLEDDATPIHTRNDWTHRVRADLQRRGAAAGTPRLNDGIHAFRILSDQIGAALMSDVLKRRPPVLNETIPSQTADVPAASASAPFIYTDWIGAYGNNGGVATFTLEAVRILAVGDKMVRDRVVVAHLRMPIHTMMALKHSIDQLALMLTPPSTTQKN
jgi:hypothetical protein